MEIKTQQAVRVLYATVSTTLAGIKQDTGTIPEDLYAEAAKSGLTPSGPQHWVYIGVTQDIDRPFHLLMGLPVAGEGTSAKYAVKELPEFKCAATIHKGSWDELGKTYAQLFGNIMQQGLKPTGDCREVYLVVDMEHPENNITEVQVGLQ